jgi:hypothetical protein
MLVFLALFAYKRKKYAMPFMPVWIWLIPGSIWLLVFLQIVALSQTKKQPSPCQEEQDNDQVFIRHLKQELAQCTPAQFGFGLRSHEEIQRPARQQHVAHVSSWEHAILKHNPNTDLPDDQSLNTLREIINDQRLR